MKYIPIHAMAARALVAVVGAGVLAFVGATAPANAAVLSATLHCEALGRGTFLCDVSISGTTAPYSVTWTAIENAGFSRTRGTLAFGFCNIGETYRIQATIRDSVGQSLTKIGGGPCPQIAP